MNDSYDPEDPKLAPKRDDERDDGEASERVQREELDNDEYTIEDEDILDAYSIEDAEPLRF
jgi:hypothetical protein